MVPNLPSWLNTEFTQRILRLAELDFTINVNDILTKAATNKSDNYTSDMMRVVVNFTRKQGDKEIEDKKSLIFKFEPLVDGTKQKIIRDSSLFDTEIAMMSNVLNKMNSMLGSRLSANVFYIRLERPLCLIVEDFAPQGFRMADRQAGFDLTHSMLVIQGLAKFHASSVALCEKEPKHKSTFNKGFFYDGQSEIMEQFLTKTIMNFASEVEQWPELGKSYADKLRNWVPYYAPKFKQAIKYNENEFSVINHGDCWVNNTLFRYDENSKPIENVFVDFQLSVYTSPAIDLHYFISTSLNENVFWNNVPQLYTEYLRILTTTMHQLGCKTLPPTMEELKKSLKKRALYAMISSMAILPILFVEKSEAKDIDEIITEGGIISGMKSSRYRERMCRRMPEYVKMGLLDI